MRGYAACRAPPLEHGDAEVRGRPAQAHAKDLLGAAEDAVGTLPVGLLRIAVDRHRGAAAARVPAVHVPVRAEMAWPVTRELPSGHLLQKGNMAGLAARMTRRGH